MDSILTDRVSVENGMIRGAHTSLFQGAAFCLCVTKRKVSDQEGHFLVPALGGLRPKEAANKATVEVFRFEKYLNYETHG